MTRVGTRVRLILDARLHCGDLEPILTCLDRDPMVKKLKERWLGGLGQNWTACDGSYLCIYVVLCDKC